jgi:hypothetical protein
MPLVPRNVLAACAAVALAAAVEGQVPCGTQEQAKVTGSMFLAQFSWTVDLSGERMLVGTRLQPVDRAAFLHERDAGGPGTWGEVERLVASDAIDGEFYGDQVAIDGERAVVGAERHVHGGIAAGAAYVFERAANGDWVEVAELLPQTPVDLLQFGFTVAISGDWILVSAVGDYDEEGIHFFRRGPNGVWALHQFFPVHLHWAVALDGSDALVGRFGIPALVFRFEPTADAWTQVATIAPPPMSGNNWGTAIGLSAGEALIASRLSYAHGIDAGSAHLYARDQGGPENWGLVRELLPTVPGPGLRFGDAVALDDGTAVVTTQNEDQVGLGPDVGAAYTYRRDEGGTDNWGLVAKLRPLDAAPMKHFGTSAAIDGRTLAVGNDADQQYGAYTGAAYLFVEARRPALAYCTAGTSASGCRALICAGASASASATSGFEVLATGVEGGQPGTFFYSTSGKAALPWGMGTSVLCMGPPLVRTGPQAGSGLPGGCEGLLSEDLSAIWSAHPWLNPGAGSVVQLQLWYRDPANTSGGGSSLSDAVEFAVVP